MDLKQLDLHTLEHPPNGLWLHIEFFVAEFVESPEVLRTKGRRTNGEERRAVSEDAGGFPEVRVQVNKNPYPAETFL